MRPLFLRRRMKTSLKLASLGVLGGLIAGCSSGVDRFDHLPGLRDDLVHACSRLAVLRGRRGAKLRAKSPQEQR